MEAKNGLIEMTGKKNMDKDTERKERREEKSRLSEIDNGQKNDQKAPGTNSRTGKERVRESNGGETRGERGEKFGRELTVEVEVEGTETLSMMDVLKGVKKECGEVLGCRVRSEKIYELTMKTETGKAKLMDGVRINGALIHARDILNNEMVVSFINLPVYMEDGRILDKLEEWGVKAMSPIKRRVWPGTDIVDGTRFLKVRFTEQVRSLPYSTKFDTMRGTEYFRVIHDRQVRVCRLCIRTGHIFRECSEFKCFKCGRTGHYARECVEWRATEEEEEESGREDGDQQGKGDQTGEQDEEGEEDMEEEQEDGQEEDGDDGGEMEQTRGAEEEKEDEEGEEDGDEDESVGLGNKDCGLKEQRLWSGKVRREEEKEVRSGRAKKISQRLIAKRQAEKDRERDERRGPRSGM